MAGEVGVMAIPTLYLFDRWDNRIGILPVSGTLTHTEELGGEDTLEFSCPVAPQKGNRILWRDPEDGSWREHEVVRTDEKTAGIAQVYAESSLCELLRDYVEEEQLVSRTAAQAARAILAHTRWKLGTVGPSDTEKHGALIYHTNALAAMRRIEEVWGGEIEPSITVMNDHVMTRTLSLPSRRGSWRGARFSYGHNLIGCTRTVLEDEVYTALYGWGKGLPIEDSNGNPTGGYTRRLSFADKNDGKKWIGNDAAKDLWGRWNDTHTAKVHSFGQAVFPDCEDPEELLALTKSALAACSQPKVSYEIDVAMIDGGIPVGLGDEVAVIDTSHNPAWRLKQRCVKRVRTFSLSRQQCHVTLGTKELASWEASAEIVYRVTAVEETATTANDSVSSLEDLNGKAF
jgi:phage minor structural protein